MIIGEKGRGILLKARGTTGSGEQAGGGWEDSFVKHINTVGKSLLGGGEGKCHEKYNYLIFIDHTIITFLGGYVCDDASDFGTMGGFGGGGNDRRTNSFSFYFLFIFFLFSFCFLFISF